MSSIKLDNAGDIQVVDNSIILTEGLDAIRQHLFVKFRFFEGEWFLDTTLGVPYFREILIKNPSLAVVQEQLKAVILDTPGVLELIRFEFEFNNATRQANLDFEALTEEGPIDFSQIIQV